MKIRKWLIEKLGGIYIDPDDKFLITEAFRTGEKRPKAYKGYKPQGYIIYKNGMFWIFLPYSNFTSIRL